MTPEENSVILDVGIGALTFPPIARAQELQGNRGDAPFSVSVSVNAKDPPAAMFCVVLPVPS